MEIGGNSRDDNRGESTNNLVWDIWELNETSRMDWTATNGTNNNYYPTAGNGSCSVTRPEGGAHNALMLNPHQCLYGGDRPNLHSDPHLVCLNLGKRHYFEDSTGAGAGEYGSAMSAERRVAGFPLVKRGKPLYGGGGGSSSSSSPVIVPRCQVEGCHVALANAKDYHRRHKVCEMHSKAPKVVVLGLEQRFCQQCSRFHVVSEFEDSKRSCKRRLAGHNERRRKSSQDHSIARNSIHGRALSLLSSKSNSDDPSYFSHSDLSSRSSAALRELIAENRAAILGRQLIVDRDWHSHNHHHPTEEHFTTIGNTNEPQRVFLSLEPNHHDHIMFGEPEPHGWDRMNGGGAHVTLDLMQAPTSAFGFVSARGKPKPEQHQSCSDFWNSFPGPNLV